MHPGTIDTDMGDRVLAIRARNMSTNDLEPARQQTLNRIPIGRMGTATHIAKSIVFLASDDSGFMTGAGLVVDGGITAPRFDPLEELEVGSAECHGQSFVGATMSGRVSSHPGHPAFAVGMAVHAPQQSFFPPGRGRLLLSGKLSFLSRR